MKIWALFYTENEYDATEQFAGFWPEKPRPQELRAVILQHEPKAEDHRIAAVFEGGSHVVTAYAAQYGGTDFELREELSFPSDLSIAP